MCVIFSFMTNCENNYSKKKLIDMVFISLHLTDVLEFIEN